MEESGKFPVDRGWSCSVSLRGIREESKESFLKLTGENAGTQQQEEVSLRHEKSHRRAELQCAEPPVRATFPL